jgi:hypothetical protein
LTNFENLLAAARNGGSTAGTGSTAGAGIGSSSNHDTGLDPRNLFGNTHTHGH